MGAPVREAGLISGELCRLRDTSWLAVPTLRFDGEQAVTAPAVE